MLRRQGMQDARRTGKLKNHYEQLILFLVFVSIIVLVLAL